MTFVVSLNLHIITTLYIYKSSIIYKHYIHRPVLDNGLPSMFVYSCLSHIYQAVVLSKNTSVNK